MRMKAVSEMPKDEMFNELFVGTQTRAYWIGPVMDGPPTGRTRIRGRLTNPSSQEIDDAITQLKPGDSVVIEGNPQGLRKEVEQLSFSAYMIGPMDESFH